MCPYYLDGDLGSLRDLRKRRLRGPGDTRYPPCERRCWHDCAVFKVRREARARDSGAGLSKLNSMRPAASKLGTHARSGRH